MAFTTILENCQVSWACKGRAQFYDCSSNQWPICNVLHDPETHVNTQIPMAEEELLVTAVKEFRCIFIKQDRYMEIVRSAEVGGSVDIDYTNIIINSANPEIGQYCFYNSIIDTVSGWFGYRVLGYSNFGLYCGANNMINIGTHITELEILSSVQNENRISGFGDIADLYQPESLMEFYGYNFPPMDALPPGLLKIPFNMRNDPEDVQVDPDSPPWVKYYYGPSPPEAPSTPVRAEEEEEEEEETPRKNLTKNKRSELF